MQHLEPGSAPDMHYENTVHKEHKAIASSRMVAGFLGFDLVVLHAVVVLAGANCCVGDAIERADECLDQAQEDSLAEADRCRRWPPSIARCLDDVYERHQERKAECRRIRDQELADCNI